VISLRSATPPLEEVANHLSVFTPARFSVYVVIGHSR